MSVQEKLQGIRQEVPQFTQGHAQLFQRAKIALRLGLVLAAPAAIIACDGASGVEPSVPMSIPLPTEMINPLDAQATGVPTVAPGANGQQQPEAPTVEPQPSPTPKVVGLMAESPGINESDWLPPTIEDTILTNQAGGGELPPQLQPLIDQAQATIAATGFAQARVEAVTNGQNSDAFRAAFVFRVPEGVIWAQGSAYPSQLNPDGSVSRSYAYVLVPGSADARIEWTAGADGSRDTETTLVKHTANLPDGRQAALLYWHTTEQTWKPIGGYPTAQEFVAVGDTIYQFSPEDGSAVEIGTIVALQSLSTNNGRVEATDANGQVFWFEEGRLVNEALLAAEATAAEVIDAATELARGLEAFAASPVSGQLEMVYSVHPEIRINAEPAKNLYNYFIEVVTTSKGFAPYWQALGLWGHAGIMNYLEQNNYRVPTQVGEQFWPTIRFIDESYIINGQESDWVRGDKRLETIDLSNLGFMLTNNEKMGNSAYADEVKALYGQGNIGYLTSGFSGALRYLSDSGQAIVVIKEAESIVGGEYVAPLTGLEVDSEYSLLLAMHATSLVRALSTSTPLQPEANNCLVPGHLTPMRRGSCIPDSANGIQDGGTEYHGANMHTLNRLGLAGLFTIQP